MKHEVMNGSCYKTQEISKERNESLLYFYIRSEGNECTYTADD